MKREEWEALSLPEKIDRYNEWASPNWEPIVKAIDDENLRDEFESPTDLLYAFKRGCSHRGGRADVHDDYFVIDDNDNIITISKEDVVRCMEETMADDGCFDLDE